MLTLLMLALSNSAAIVHPAPVVDQHMVRIAPVVIRRWCAPIL